MRIGDPTPSCLPVLGASAGYLNAFGAGAIWNPLGDFDSDFKFFGIVAKYGLTDKSSHWRGPAGNVCAAPMAQGMWSKKSRPGGKAGRVCRGRILVPKVVLHSEWRPAGVELSRHFLLDIIVGIFSLARLPAR